MIGVITALGALVLSLLVAGRDFRRQGGAIPHRPYRRAYGDAPGARDGARRLAGDSHERLDTLTRGTR